MTEGRDFTPEESKKIEELHELREELFSEIALIIASRLGYSTDKVEDLAKLFGPRARLTCGRYGRSYRKLGRCAC